jgi:hypothetical protein
LCVSLYFKKLRRQYSQAKQKIREATPEEKIAHLEEIRAGLVSKSKEIERKIEEIEKRQQGATREESMVGRERR